LAHDVFISYSSENKAVADAVCHRLEARGIRCWIAPRDVKGGREYAEAIIEAIHEARAMVLVFSSHANASADVRSEVQTAFNRGIVVVPLRIEEVQPSGSLEYYLAGRHWLDAVTPPLKARLQLLADNLEGLIRPPEGGSPSQGQSGLQGGAPRRRPVRRRTAYAAGAVAAAVIIAAGAGYLVLAPKPASPAELQACNAYLGQNYQFQADSAAYANTDMGAHEQAASQLIRAGQSGRSVYFATPPPAGLGDYGRLSHYWETFANCVDRKVLRYDDVSDTVSFPDDFWNKTRSLRQLFAQNWRAPGSGIPDFMSNFRALCQEYRRQRAGQREDVSHMDCTS
jgi:hypothetical protein